VSWQTQKKLGVLGNSQELILSIFPENSQLGIFGGIIWQAFWQSVNMCLHAFQTFLFVTHQLAISVSPTITSII
jgi:hypothetical protein